MKVYKNILSQKEKLKLFKFAKKIVKDLGPDFPGLQSSPDLHQYKELKILIDKIKDIIDGPNTSERPLYDEEGSRSEVGARAS